ncbi:MAG: O-antigen ligase family protein [Deltaproteobacteria bacterium]|nr:O-antigen ligase family protein [Deltaproteobacteria bacterium]
MALSIFFFHLPETGAIWITISFFTVLVFLHPLNGISFLLLTIPFFLGNPSKPYIFLQEIFLYGTGISLTIRRPWRRQEITFPLKIPLALFLLSACLSLPLNLRELLYTLWALPSREIFYQWLSGNPGLAIHSLRVLFNLLSAAALSLVFYKTLSDEVEPFLTRVIRAQAVWTALIAVTGFLLLWGYLPRGRTYASLSLVGIHEGAITAFAFNRQFLAQYLLLCLPLTIYLGLRQMSERKVAWLLAVVASILVSVFALAASMQRSVYIVLALQLGYLAVAYGRLLHVRKKILLLFYGSPLLIAAGLFLMDWTFFNQNFLQRLQLLGQIRDIRPALWGTAWAMFSFSPWLGIGLGRYYYFFPEFFPGLPGTWQQFNANRGNAHSVYVQLLAEQGIFGLLLFGILIGALLTLAGKGLARETQPDRKSLLLAVTASVTTWLVLGLFHHIAYDLRSLEIFFWIFFACLLILTRGLSPSFRPGRKILIGVLVLLAAAGGYQIKLIRDYPLGKNFQAGFYPWEKEPDGSRWRWMGRRAVACLETQPGTLLIECRAPLPEIEKKPQQVQMLVNNRVYRFSLGNRDWARIRIPSPEPRPPTVVLRLTTDYTINPAQAGGSRDQRDLGLQLREFQWEAP